VELAADNKDFSSVKRPRTPSHTPASPQRDPSPRPPSPRVPPDQGGSPASPTAKTPVRTVQWAPQGTHPHPHPHPGPLVEPPRGRGRYREEEGEEEQGGVLLHTLLMVPDGKEFVCEPMQSPNFYLNCRLLGSDETARSVVSWGQRSPTFNFLQVSTIMFSSTQCKWAKPKRDNC